VVPLASKIATAPIPGVAAIWAARPAGGIGHSHISIAEGLHVEGDAPGRKELLKMSMRPAALGASHR